MMAYTPEQKRNLRLAKTVGRQVGATATEQKAAIEAQLVESNARNLNYGDRDSKGILQQRPSQGWAHATDPAGALRDFYQHARQYRGKGLSSGALAQAVQRSAFPGRYQQRASEAAQVLGSNGGGSGGGSGAYTPAPVENTDARRQLLLTYLTQRDSPDALLNLAAGLQNLQSAPAPTTTSRTKAPAPDTHQTVVFDGKPVLAWMVPELKYARQNGWKGTVTSGERTKAQQMQAATKFGLNRYGSGGPLASNHVYGHPGAVDVTDPNGFEQALSTYRKPRRLRRDPSIHDPVHFSISGR